MNINNNIVKIFTYCLRSIPADTKVSTILLCPELAATSNA